MALRIRLEGFFVARLEKISGPGKTLDPSDQPRPGPRTLGPQRVVEIGHAPVLEKPLHSCRIWGRTIKTQQAAVRLHSDLREDEGG